MRKLGIFLLTAALIAAMAGCATAQDSLGTSEKEGTSSLQMFRITTLSTNYLHIANFTGLEFCTNLHYLFLNLNHKSDIPQL